MSEIQLRPFQIAASNSISERFSQLSEDPDRPMHTRQRPVPYYQGLNAITGAGKTAILADGVSSIRSLLPHEPVVIWISKAKAVVEQTLSNFDGGGKYAHLVPDFVVLPLAEINENYVSDGDTPLMAVATVGTFNDNSREEGSRRFYRAKEDQNRTAPNQMLRERKITRNVRRPLIIVYDEGHNLTDQQTDLLLELDPDVILVASGTMKTPGRLGKLIDRLRDHGWDEERLVTAVKSLDVVDAGLVKRQIVLGGYATLMESAIDDMLDQMKLVEKKVRTLRAGFKPKAIYVCKTNISQLDGTVDNPARPFNQRQAPPILIWRYLVEKKKVDPRDIAVYCDLKMDRKHNPPPADFIHFSGGDDDFGVFSQGNFHHIIFNQSLQEGWDDPECCFAYIDKSMGSSIQVHQVIGRVLRQPGTKHYPDADLNSANFYIRIDNKQMFPEILEEVQEKIGAEIPAISIEGFSDRKAAKKIRSEPKKALTIPEIHIHLDQDALDDELDRIIDYTNDRDNIFGGGERYRAVQKVGDGSHSEIEEEVMQHSNLVMARWIVRRVMQSLYPEAVKAIDWFQRKFDARVEVTSRAAADLREAGERLVNTYLEHCELSFEETNPYTVGPVVANPAKVRKFKYSLHEGYSDISNAEVPYADAIDKLKLPWVRNPSNGGYSIPLLKAGGTYKFFPDFIVWNDDIVYAIDPKGGHLIAEAAGKKLFDIRDERGRRKVIVRLITEGKSEEPGKKKSAEGYTLWSLGTGGTIRPRHYPTIAKAIEAAVKPR